MNRTELLKISKPILFNTEMVKAILDGRKTVTRRVVKPSNKRYFIDKTLSGKPAEFQMISIDEAKFIRMAKPQYKVNDTLYVRETWCTDEDMVDVFEENLTHGFYYRANEINQEWVNDKDIVKWKPSIHMPKSAARIFLKVTDVRVERLHDITYEQVIKKGLEGGIKCDCHFGCEECLYTSWAYPADYEFALLWDSTIKKQDLDKYGWNANPWVWVYEFERVECDERD